MNNDKYVGMDVHNYYQGMVSRGMRSEMARLQVARKLAAITLAVWKQEAEYESARVNKQVA